MANLLKKSHLERTDFGSFGWIGKVSRGLWEVWFFPGADSQAESFRSRDNDRLDPRVHQTEFSDAGWIYQIVAPADVWATAKFAGTGDQTKSFRSDDNKKLDLTHLTSPRFQWFSGLLPPWATEYIPAIYSLSNSFRSKGSEKLSSQVLLGFDTLGWIATEAEGLSTTPTWTNVIVEGIDSITGEFHQVIGRYRIR